jgi:aspartyl-tRNA(Asn)/glutamyl-tRNA(Gln) amidotransferase subunit B
VISREWVDEIRSELTELPDARRDRFMTQYGLPVYDANLLTASRAMADYFEDCLKTEEYGKLPPAKGAKEVSNWILGEVSRIMNATNIDIDGFRTKVCPEKLCQLLVLIQEGSTGGPGAKSVFEEMATTGGCAADIIKEKGLSQISDTESIDQEIIAVLDNNAQAVADYRAGKEQSLKFLVGQVMKATRGRANPQLVNELLKKKLEEG